MHLSVGSTYLAPQLFQQKIWDGVACAHLVMLAAGAVCVVCVRKEGKEEGAVKLVMMMMMLLAWRGWHDFAWLPRYQLSDAGYVAARYECACVCACVWALCGGRVTVLVSKRRVLHGGRAFFIWRAMTKRTVLRAAKTPSRLSFLAAADRTRMKTFQ